MPAILMPGITASLVVRWHQNTKARYTGQIVDELGAGIDAASLTTLTLTLYDLVSNTIINGRNAQNILNANNVTVDASGNLVWSVQPSDNPIYSSTPVENELHIALFQWTWGVAGVNKGNHEVGIRVIALKRLS